MTTSTHTASRHSKKQNRLRWILGGTIIGASIVALVSVQLGNNAVYFYTPDEAFAKATQLAGKTVRVGGMVLPGSVNWQAEELDLQFKMSDLKGHEIAVRHRGAAPDMFKEGQGVVVEGLLEKNTDATLQMTASKLMVKHSEEYKKPGDHSQGVEKELLQKSIFKDQP
jgi:cytochrome c-type biogenesis protein CcmE